MHSASSSSSTALLAFVVMLVVVASSLTRSIEATADRTVTVTVNPECDACGKNTTGTYNNLVYVQATGDQDIVHMLFSSVGAFTVMMFRTALNVTLSVNASALLSANATEVLHSIRFSATPLEQFGYVFPTIYEFNDAAGTGDMTQTPQNASYWRLYETAALQWSPYQALSNASGLFQARHPVSGAFKFVIRFSARDERDTALPHLLLNAGTSTVDFVLDNVAATFKDAKFGVRTVFLSEYAQVTQSAKRTLDDEYTPGTFKLYNVEVSDTQGTVHNHMQWRPIFYFYDPKSLENSTLTKQYELRREAAASVGDVATARLGVGAAFFAADAAYSAMNISFGLDGDEKNGYFYTQSNYSAWTFSVGVGESPDEQMSLVVFVVIIVGFGLPALIILIGIVVMVGKKIKNSRNSEFTPL